MADLSWTLPVMRAGYAGRGVTYLAVAGLSLWGLSRGRDAEGTTSAMQTLSTSYWGMAVLWAIALGLLAYTIWRLIDAALDLEDYGTSWKGVIARLGMVTTGLLHGVIGVLAALLATGTDRGDGRGFSGIVGQVLDLPGGRWVIGAAAALTIGAGLYYLAKGIRSSYRKHLRANPVTRHWDPVLKFGVMAQALVITIIGGLLALAAWRDHEGQTGGVEAAFEWLQTQPFGQTMVTATCVGFLAFALFCFVNAAYRTIPRVDGDDVETLLRAIRAAA